VDEHKKALEASLEQALVLFQPLGHMKSKLVVHSFVHRESFVVKPVLDVLVVEELASLLALVQTGLPPDTQEEQLAVSLDKFRVFRRLVDQVKTAVRLGHIWALVQQESKQVVGCNLAETQEGCNKVVVVGDVGSSVEKQMENHKDLQKNQKRKSKGWNMDLNRDQSDQDEEGLRVLRRRRTSKET